MNRLQARAGDKDDGRKLKYFVRGDMHVSSAQLRALKAAGGLLVNGEPARADRLLCSGDEVCLLLKESAPKHVEPEFEPVSIPYEDYDVYIVDKPAPLACQCTPRQEFGTLENRLRGHFTEDEDFVFRPLNRLDKGTSGLLAAAKHAHACAIMQAQLHTEAFVREYLAVVEGELFGEGAIDLPIAKAEGPTVRRAIDMRHGQRAITHYRVEAVHGGRSLLRLWLETGRTHQIRVHMAALGHPVVGDFLYGEETPELTGRFALHSTHIEFNHPISGDRISVTSPLPEELGRLMALE